MRHAGPVRKRLVLIGGGHSHVFVLASLAMRPEPGVSATLIARELDAPYSGMLPGYVAGHYTLEECHIDLVRLAQRAGVRVVHGEAIGLDRENRRVVLKGRPPIGYDVASIDTGITPSLGDIRGADQHAIAVKPVSAFAPKWQHLLARALKPDGPRRIAVIGTGAAGFELVLSMRYRILADAGSAGIDGRDFSFTIIGSGGVLPTHNARAQRIARRVLDDNGVAVIERDSVVAVTASEIVMASGRRLATDAVLVTTKAAPPAWFARSGLPRDAGGFVAVKPTLQLLDDDDVFAAGDCAAVLEHPREKAGVFAVRQGPPLTENIRFRCRGEAAQPFVPQRQFLTLLALGEKSAIAARGPFTAWGAWAWRWKDRIDREFMDRFNMLGGADGMEDADEALRCAGCAAKIGPVTLERALGRLPQPPAGLAVRDLAPKDDAAVLDLGGTALRLETADFFRSIWPEPYVMGEIAAAHAMSDVFAKGGTPDHALAVAVLPESAPHIAEDDLFQLMSGARALFDAEGVALVGGHSGEGPELSVGFFVSGAVTAERLWRKSGLRPGDRLILTKPVGTGILFAAWMRGLARAREIGTALAVMRQSNGAAARALLGAAVNAATDVTGFGLAGHLIEMLEASGCRAEIDMTRLPLLDGVKRLAALGIGSTLLPENLRLADRLGGLAVDAATLAILFDPQTSGGLLIGMPASAVEASLGRLRAAGVAATEIGSVMTADGGDARLTIKGA